MAIADVRYGSMVFLAALTLVFVGGALNLLGAIRYGLVFQRSRDIAKADEPVTYGFLLGVNTLMVVGVVLASVIVLITRNS